jgi:hypothetical protein
MRILGKPGFLGGFATVAAAGLLLAGCSSGGSMNGSAMNNPGMNNSMKTPGVSSMHMKSVPQNEFGGPMYTGKPDLPLTVAFVQAGGGPGNFSLVTALNSMLGADMVNQEVAKLTNQYGKQRVQNWVKGINYAVKITLQTVKEKGMQLPSPANLQGKELAMALVKAGTVMSNTPANNTFWAGLLFDRLLSHPIHEKVMAKSDQNYSKAWDGNYHQITNQAMYDLAQALGMPNVKLAPYH